MNRKDKEFEILFVMAELVRVNSGQGKLTTYADFTLEPVSLPVEAVEAKLAELKTGEAYQDIRFIEGSGKTFLYSSDEMTESYAKLLVRVEAGNLLELIADTVREESRLYPRPTDIRLFQETPYKIPVDTFNSVWERMNLSGKYQDIKEVTASNGAIYLYSERFMPRDHAIALVEWVEVIQKEIP